MKMKLVLSLFACCASCFGQGTLQFRFDGPPTVEPGAAIGVQRYSEAGMSFVPLSFSFGRIGSSPQGGRPDNGTAYLQAALSQSLAFSFLEAAPFDLLSVDLAEYSTLYQAPGTVEFIGYRADGSSVSTALVTDGLIDGAGPVADFQTFQFGAEWRGLTRVEVPTSLWSLDNLVVSVPEPGTGALTVLGAALLGLRLGRRRK